jgi:hypothetical protein
MADKKEKKYPNWICHECGVAYGGWYKKGTYIGPKLHYATVHQGNCDLCGAIDVPVTEPRDYGYLRARWKTEFNAKHE